MIRQTSLITTLLLTFAFLFACGKPKSLEIEGSGIKNNQECDAEGKNCIGNVEIGDSNLTCQLIASSGKLNKGQSVTLTIATTATLQAAEINKMAIADVSAPKLSLTPQATTNYEAFITSSTGTTAKCAARVEVIESNGNPIPMCTLTAPRTTINEGESIKISMSSSNATSGSLQDVTMSGSSAEKTVSPTADTTYEGKVAGPGGNNTCSIAILVIPKPIGPKVLPTCTITASKASIQRGQAVTLTMTSTNATSATLQTLAATTGSFIKSFSPTEPTTYMGTVINADGSDKCEIFVEVTEPPVAAPTCTISVSPQFVAAGANVTVSYTSKNATTATLNGLAVQTGSGSSGFSPNSTQNFAYVVTNSAGVSTTCTGTVEVGAKPFCTMTANPLIVNAGSYTSVTVSASSATEISVNGVSVPIANPTKSFAVSNKTTFVGTAKNKYGSANCTTTPIVNVILPAKTCAANASSTPCVCGSGQVRKSASFIAASSACRMETYGSTGIYCIFQAYAGLPCNGCYLVCQTQ